MAIDPDVQVLLNALTSRVDALENATPSVGMFRLFNAMNFTGQPEIPEMEVLQLLNPWHFWPSGPVNGQWPNELPDESQVRSVAQQFSAEGMMCLDIEHYPFSSQNTRIDPEDLKDAAQKLATLMHWYKSEVPGQKVGYYSMVPLKDYWKAVQPPRRWEWHEDEDFGDCVGQQVDVLFPSVYPPYTYAVGDPNEAQWEYYCSQNLAEARRRALGKPVYAFVEPWFQGGTVEIPGDVWRKQLDFIRYRCDGIVFFGGWQKQWDDNAPWWLETQDFLAA